MNQWKTVPIKELYEGLYDGPHATPKPSDDGPVFLGITNVTDDGRLDLSDIRHIADEDFAHWTRRVEPRPGDLVFTYEATLNRYAIIPKGFRGCLGRRMALIRPDKSKLDVRYLLYYFFTNEWRSVIASNMMSGATVDRIPLITFPNFPIRVPPLPIQREVAGILSAYDDLIENNTRRIQVLERMAQAIYREWFVNFRFPGHANAKLVASPLGSIPNGWQTTNIGNVIETLGGGTPSTKNPAYWDDGRINWYSPSDLTAAGALFVAESSRKITELGLQESSAKIFPANCVMMTSRATIGVVAINSTPATTNQGFITCIPNARLCAYHIAEWIKHNLTLITQVASGATFKEISRGEFRELPIILPSQDIEENYQCTVDSMYQQIRVLLAKNVNLRRTRDLLLPRLLSGQLELKMEAS